MIAVTTQPTFYMKLKKTMQLIRAILWENKMNLGQNNKRIRKSKQNLKSAEGRKIIKIKEK